MAKRAFAEIAKMQTTIRMIPVSVAVILCGAVLLSTSKANDAGPYLCGHGMFRCTSAPPYPLDACIPMNRVCDGHPDCYDGEDEDYLTANCKKSRADRVLGDTTIPCPGNFYKCPQSDRCILIEQICDGMVNCEYHDDDEGPFCQSPPAQYDNCNTHPCGGDGLLKSFCKETSKGPICYCEEGYSYNSQNSQCQVLCDQHYNNITSRCSCDLGYSLHKGRLCIADRDRTFPPTILLTTSDNIQQRRIDGSNLAQPYIIPGNESTAMDFNYKNKSLCWLSMVHGIARMKCGMLNDVTILWDREMEFVLRTVEHMALDWLTGTWYFTDNLRKRIFICTSSGLHCKTIITNGLTKIKGLALDARAGYMFYSDWADKPAIKRTLLNGEQIKPIAEQKVILPYGVTLDYANKLVYWADSGFDTIQRVDYNGHGKMVIYRGILAEHVHSLTLFENHLYLSSQFNRSVIMIHKSPQTQTETHSVLISKLRQPGAIHIFHQVRQPESSHHPCDTNNGGCDQFCIASSQTTSSCYCGAGYRFNTDTGSCQAFNLDQYLVYSSPRRGIIEGISLDSSIHDNVITPLDDVNIVKPVAMAFDQRSQYLYFSDEAKSHIGRRKVNGGDIELVITTGLSKAVSLAVDSISGNIYWIDRHKQQLIVARIQDQLTKPLYRKVIFNAAEVSMPIAVAIDPVEKYMYFCHWKSRNNSKTSKNSVAIIERANLDGSDRQILVDGKSGQLKWVYSLYLDKSSKRLYWADAYKNTIHSVNVRDFSDIKVEASNLNQPHSVVFYNNVLYWSEYMNDRIRYKLTNTEMDNVTILREDAQPLALTLIDTTDKAKGTNACSVNNGDCAHLCLPLPDAGKVCSCADGWLKDGTGCKEKATPPPVQCKTNEFQCVSDQTCISVDKLCDHTHDCHDGSDEQPLHDCPCGANKYKCKNSTQCIEKIWVCDRDVDCPNHDDEENCSKNCSADYMRCNNNGICIPDKWRCDHQDDCPDGEDEKDCANTGYKSQKCAAGQFQCELDGRCIDQKYLCDKQYDCTDLSDEKNCSYSCNPVHHFVCDGGGDKVGNHCIPFVYKCDGYPHCDDGSDERFCPNFINMTTMCHPSEFACNNGECIPLTWQCDQDDDCGDYSDEAQCKGRVTCKAHEFPCGVDECIPLHKKCDGFPDCLDGSDESNKLCSYPSECIEPNQICPDNPLVCLTPEMLCDGRRDCQPANSTSWDESLLCSIEACSFLTYQCSHLCHNSPTGTICYCPEGMELQSDKKTCKKIDVCKRWGICSQSCETLPNEGHKCTCFEKYQLAMDGFTCKPIGNEPVMILFSNRHEIRRVNVSTREYAKLIAGLRNTIAIDFHYKNQSVFWTDVVDDKIFTGHLTANAITNIKPVIDYGLATTEGLAIDWIANNIYWVESNLDQIEVAKLDGQYRTTLIAGDMVSPRAIVLDPRKGYLFWTDWDGRNPRIERCSMSGSHRQIIFKIERITGGGWPNGLALDYDFNRLYWIDARSDSIHTITYAGSGHRVILQNHESMAHPFALSLFGNYVYWTDWNTNAVVKANKFNGSNAEVIQKIKTQPFDLHVFHPLRQPEGKNPCEADNGKCSHLCLIDLGSTVGCKCPHLMKLMSDNKTCEEDQSFLFFAQNHMLRGVGLYDAHINVIPTVTKPKVLRPTFVDYYLKGNKTFWTDIDDSIHAIRSADLNGMNIQTVIDTGHSHPPTGLAVDWLSGNLYYMSTDTGSNTTTISVSSLEGAYRKELIANLTSSSSLVVNPATGIMYWIQSAGKASEIKSAKMDGSKVTTLFSGDNVKHAFNLKLHAQDNALYWLNGDSGVLCRGDLVNKSTTNLITVNLASSLAIGKDFIYISEQMQIMRWNMNSEDKAVRFRGSTMSVTAMAVYDPNMQPEGKNGCSKKTQCTQLCLPIGVTEHVCHCAAGYFLDSDKYTCTGIQSFLLVVLDTQIKGYSLDNSSSASGWLSSAFTPILKMDTATAVDFHVSSDYVYWVDIGMQTISRVSRDMTVRETILEKGLKGVDGMAIDWIAGNIYWTDFKSQTISVSKLNGSSRYIIIHDRLVHPKSIVLHPTKGYMFWADSKEDKIERAFLDGSGRKVILDNSFVLSPSGLAIDYAEDQLYFCTRASNKIQWCDFDGLVPKTFTDNMTDCTGVAILGDYVYWIDATDLGGSIKRKKKHVNGVVEILKSGLGAIKDLRIFDTTLQPPAPDNLCRTNNGGCAELCLSYGTGRTCACAYGHLAPDGTSCEKYKTYLLYSEVISIESLHLNVDVQYNTPPKLPITDEENMKNVIGLAFDYNSGDGQQLIFYSDIQKGEIRSVTAEGTSNKLVAENVGSAEGLAFDGINKFLYWTSYTDSSINRIKPYNDTYPNENVVQLTPKDHPRAIAVDSCQRRIFWTNWNSHSPCIQTSDLDGHHVFSIISTAIQTPNGLTIDHQLQKLYWSDARLDKIERCNFDGSNRQEVLSSIPRHSFGLAVYGDSIYWTDWMHHAVYHASKLPNDTPIPIQTEIQRQPMAIIAVAPDTNNCTLNPCYGKCKGLGCIVTDQGMAKCTCGDGKTVLEIGGIQSCAGPCNSSTEFQCKNGMCIKNKYKCDRDADCSDYSDEIGCNLTCSDYTVNGEKVKGLIPCKNTSMCILASWICDNNNDCWDNSDEMNCEDKQSCEESFRCDSGACISKQWVCDRDDDCGDKSDERNCSYKCDVGLFQCQKFSTCIPEVWMCDGQHDCPDGSDENPDTCKNTTCSKTQFKCSNGRCIPNEWKCDGDRDCSDGKDEHPDKGCAEVTCGPNQFRCDNLRCIQDIFYCDFHHDCGGNDTSDEPKTCSYKQRRCDRDEFQCASTRHCISNSSICDGFPDCEDASDEQNCPLINPMTPCGNETVTMFQCNNGQCIDESLVCNDQNDCDDWSDESHLCYKNECSTHNLCSHKCHDQKIGYRCSCNPGYHLRDDKKTCEDIDECLELPCGHYCQNLIGGYECSCAQNFTLENNLCKPSYGGLPQLLVANRYYLRLMYMYGNTRRLQDKLNNAVAVDYDWQDRYVYWSDVTTTESKISRMKFNFDEDMRQQTIAQEYPSPEELHKSTVRNPDGIAVDWIARNLYWCDKTTDTIEVSKLDGKFRKVLVRGDLQEPRALEVFPQRGLIFYTDWGEQAHIGRMSMDGSQRKNIITEELGWPNALTIDYETDHIFWADASLDFIAMADLDGRNKRIVESKDVPHVFAISVFAEYLYWTDWEHKAVFKAHKYTSANKTKIHELIHRPMDIQVFHPLRRANLKREDNPCYNNGGCENLCLLRHDPEGSGMLKHVCACPENHYLAKDEKSCHANCTSSQFLCKYSYKCIPFWWRCDGNPDCEDGTDEDPQCLPYYCSQHGMYQCQNATSSKDCIPPTQICDGHPQCADASDEANCTTYTCMSSQRKCEKSHKCISATQWCDKHEDCEDGEDEQNCDHVRCSENQFNCSNGRCIPYVWRCDLDDDCGDSSDENDDCSQLPCKDGYIKCNITGRCIPEKWQCDGDTDCGQHDNTDEDPDICSQKTCGPDQFQCDKNRCIPRRWMCDHDQDCRDGKDETTDCVARNCSESEFRCDNERCIHISQYCDGIINCEDGSDEHGCSSSCDTLTKFKCKSTDDCIELTWRCDGDADCPDSSDEFDCSNKCGLHEFQCNNTLCQPIIYLCDGENDCGDRSDEEPSICKNRVCPRGKTQCRNSSICVWPSKLCDGVNDCGDNSDEESCMTTAHPCLATDFKCNTTSQCVSPDKVCNKNPDCDDASDESPELCHTNYHSCELMNHNLCEQGCRDTNYGPMCYCDPGFTLAENMLKCHDIDECQLYKSCDQQCENLIGGYKCVCSRGYKRYIGMYTNTSYCQAEGSRPYLLVAYENMLVARESRTSAFHHSVYMNPNKDIRIRALAIDISRLEAFTIMQQTKKIYRIEIPRNFTKMGNRSPRHLRRRALPITGLLEPQGLAVDWISKNIYWTDAGLYTVEMASYMSNDLNAKRKTIISRHLDKPHAIAVAPYAARLFWTDIGVEPKIETSYLDGSNRTTIVRDKLIMPVGLAVDEFKERLYWVDAKTHMVQSVTYTGGDRKIVIKLHVSEPPLGIDVFENSLYIYTGHNHSIIKVNKLDGSRDRHHTMRNLLKVHAIAVVHEQKQQLPKDIECSIPECDPDAICVNIPRHLNKKGFCCLWSDTQKHFDERCTFTFLSSCKPGYCLNGGTCNVNAHNYTCSCLDPYVGQRCGIHKRCLDFCQNGGECYFAVNSTPLCKCSPNYSGATCEMHVQAQHQARSFKIISIVIPSVLMVFALVLILSIFIWRKRKSLGQFKHYRIQENGKVEIKNPIFVRPDGDEGDQEADERQPLGESFGFDGERPTNFSNPMYDRLYTGNENHPEVIKGRENAQLLQDDLAVSFYGNEGKHTGQSSVA